MSVCVEVNKAGCCCQVTLKEKYESAMDNAHQSSARQLEKELSETCRKYDVNGDEGKNLNLLYK